jgi:polyisoprenoid-binding protein YceI
MWGLMGIKGIFTDVSGDGVLGSDGDATGTVTIAAASIDTKNAKRDTHLKSKDFLSVEDHPDMVVTVSSIRAGADKVTVEGTLTAVDKTVPLSFPATLAVTGSTAVLDASITIDRSELGLTWNQMGMVSMKNDITVHFVFTHV